jgi:diadenosine tetraphosphate (Ap4A) HIT family hydrolase
MIVFVQEETMKTDPDCIFCKIVAGQMPCFKLLEDDDTLAFMDICPVNDGHCLVVAKEHYPTLFDISDEALPRCRVRSAALRERSIRRYRRLD